MRPVRGGDRATSLPARYRVPLDSAGAKGYVALVIFRRMILILCLVAIIPTAVDPSCVRYFMYANGGLVSLFADGDDDAPRGVVDDAERPTEVLATARVPSAFTIAPHFTFGFVVYFPVVAPRGGLAAHADAAPDFLAPSLHSSFLRHSVLLI